MGQFVAGLTGASGSPVVAVGELQIDFTPPWLKNFAITEFGSDDKLVLVSGILVVLAIFAAVIGAASTIRQHVLEMPAPVVAGALGYPQVTTAKLAAKAGGNWSRYAPGDHQETTYGHHPAGHHAKFTTAE